MVIGWCRAHLPAAIKVNERLLKNEVNEHMRSSGKIPDGAEVGGGGERFYVK